MSRCKERVLDTTYPNVDSKAACLGRHGLVALKLQQSFRVRCRVDEVRAEGVDEVLGAGGQIINIEVRWGELGGSVLEVEAHEEVSSRLAALQKVRGRVAVVSHE